MKTTKILTILVLALGLILCQTGVSRAEPMGTAFTYQGHLSDANAPADDIYDFQFTLYDTPDNGGLVAGPLDIEDVNVLAGLFTVQIDFGSNVFEGEACWLEVGIRPDWAPPEQDYTILSPRQEITPVPYAIRAQTIGTGGGGLTLPYAGSTSTAGDAFSITNTGTGRAIYGHASNSGSCTNYGGYFKADGQWGRAVYAEATNTSGQNNYGGHFKAAGGIGVGVFSEATGTGGTAVRGEAQNIGVWGEAKAPGGYGVYGWASATSGTGYGVWGQTSSSSGYAGYFDGNVKITGTGNGLIFPDGSKQTTAATGGTGDNLGNHTATQNINLNGNYLSGDGNNEGVYVKNDGNVGIGTSNPISPLEVAGTVHSTSGGFKFPDGTLQTSTASSKAQTWGFFQDYQTNSTSPVTKLNISGAGYLYELIGRVIPGSSTSPPGVKVTVDGGSPTFLNPLNFKMAYTGTNSLSYDHYRLTLNLRFNSSLKIEMWSNDGAIAFLAINYSTDI